MTAQGKYYAKVQNGDAAESFSRESIRAFIADAYGGSANAFSRAALTLIAAYDQRGETVIGYGQNGSVVRVCFSSEAPYWGS